METLLHCFEPGRRIYLPGGVAEILPLADALASDPGRMKSVSLTSCLIPGINRTDYGALDPAAELTTFMMSPTLRVSAQTGRLRILPLCYSAIARYLTALLPDCAIAHVAPADANGFCSLGVSADFTSLVWPTADFRVLVVNARMPNMRRAPRLALADAHLIVEIDAPLVVGGEDRQDPILEQIAASVAALTPNGAAIQCGIGGAPGAAWRHLRQHRDLTIASGMVTSALQDLAEAGALRDGDRHQAGIALGGAAFHRYLESADWIEMAPVTHTHDVTALARLEAFTAINSALEVDLFGQANLEWRDGKPVSGVGGAPDFARAAANSRGGRSIIALPATAAGGTISRIVARLDTPTVSISRADIDTVITEHGTAELLGRSVEERATALIAIAAPAHREALLRQWRSGPSGLTLRKDSDA